MRNIWNILGHIFRLKTIGDILGWWNTESWQRILASAVAAVLTFISNHLNAPVWVLPIIGLVAFMALISLISRINLSAVGKGSNPSETKPTLSAAPTATTYGPNASIRQNIAQAGGVITVNEFPPKPTAPDWHIVTTNILNVRLEKPRQAQSRITIGLIVRNSGLPASFIDSQLVGVDGGGNPIKGKGASIFPAGLGLFYLRNTIEEDGEAHGHLAFYVPNEMGIHSLCLLLKDSFGVTHRVPIALP